MGMIISIHASAKEATEIRARGPHSKKDFNPRLREGGDVLNLASAGAMSLISIHASAKEATCKDIKAGLISHISIHASAKEATRPRIGFEKLSAISIHASAKEAT